MPINAAKHWMEKYGVGTRIKNVVVFGPPEATRFAKRFSEGTPVETGLLEAGRKIALEHEVSVSLNRRTQGAFELVFKAIRNAQTKK
ncbi:MAG: hypothetical protein V1644_03345 [Candidatus Micrarchaeota archaeon]